MNCLKPGYVAILVVLLVTSGWQLLGARATASGPANEPASAVSITGGTQTPTETHYLDSHYDPSKGYSVDSQEITPVGGYDVPQLNALFPTHRLDLKWTLKNDIQCFNIGSDPCDINGIAPRYFDLTCSTPRGQSACGGPGVDWGGLSDDPALGCPVYQSSFVPIMPGQSLTFCTSSTLSTDQAAAKVTYSIGYEVPYVQDTSHITVSWGINDPWNDQTGKPIPPPTVQLMSPPSNFTVEQGDQLTLSAIAQSSLGTPAVTFSASWPGQTTSPNKWFRTVTTADPHHTYRTAWNLQLPDGSYVPSGQVSITATACIHQTVCTTTSAHVGQVRRRVFIFTLGLSAGYDARDKKHGFSDVQTKLAGAYPASNFQVFMYPCISGVSGCTASSYPGVASCTALLQQDVSAMDAQIKAAASTPNSDIYVLGDSLGGVVDLGYVGLTDVHGWQALANGSKLRGIMTFDAPIGGIPNKDIGLMNLVFSWQCYYNLPRQIKPLQQLVELSYQYLSPNQGSMIGAYAQLTKLLFPNATGASNTDNQQLAVAAAGHGTRVMSIGNVQDYGFIPAYCGKGYINFTASQFLLDQPARHTYSRYISVGQPIPFTRQPLPLANCATAIFNEVNHGVVLQDNRVLAAVVAFVQGQTPSQLPSYPAKQSFLQRVRGDVFSIWHDILHIF